MNTEEFIELYHSKKKELEKQTAEVERIRDEIKSRLSDLGLDEYRGKNYTVSTTTINTDRLDTQKLIQLLREEYPEAANEVIFLTPTLDLDKVEDLVYNRVIPATVVSSCIVHRTPTIRVNLKKTKGDK